MREISDGSATKMQPGAAVPVQQDIDGEAAVDTGDLRLVVTPHQVRLDVLAAALSSSCGPSLVIVSACTFGRFFFTFTAIVPSPSLPHVLVTFLIKYRRGEGGIL